MKIRDYILTLILVGVFAHSHGQESTGLAMLAKSDQSSIHIRWAPTDPLLWQLGNQFGYILERTTLVRNGKVLPSDQRETKKLTPRSLKPLQLQDWELLVDENDYAAIAAQAIYGDDFQFSFDDSDVLESINKVKELESRFSFALYAADISLEVAKNSGLYFHDEEINPDEKYLYRVFIGSNVLVEGVNLDTASYFIGMDDYYPLPTIDQFDVEFRDRAVTFVWNYADYKSFYTSYIIEKSVDGVNFEPISKERIVPTISERKVESRVAYYTDSLSNNSESFSYRLRGVSPFAEIGPPSEVVAGSGVPNFEFTPNITVVDTIDNEIVNLEWEFPTKGREMLRGFKVLRSDNEGAGYSDISGSLNPGITSFTDSKPRYSNYYIIEATSIDGQVTRSIPRFSQLEDNIPPVQPVGLQGSIDTTGLVTLSWTPNPDSDLIGYRVFKKNFRHEELLQITTEVLEFNGYTDTIKLNTLTESIYYAIQAIDLRYNESIFSQIIKLEKPDLIPPVPPTISSIKEVDGSSLITWIVSSSDDVIGYLIYRTEDGVDWELVGSVESKELSLFKDELVVSNTRYDYLLVAMDDSGLESEPSETVSIKISSKNDSPSVIAKAQQGGILLRWNGNREDIRKVKIYKSMGDQALSLFRSLEGNSIQLLDDQLIIGNKYKYQVQFEYVDGTSSKFSAKLSVDY